MAKRRRTPDGFLMIDVAKLQEWASLLQGILDELQGDLPELERTVTKSMREMQLLAAAEVNYLANKALAASRRRVERSFPTQHPIIRDAARSDKPARPT